MSVCNPDTDPICLVWACTCRSQRKHYQGTTLCYRWLLLLLLLLLLPPPRPPFQSWGTVEWFLVT